MNKQAWTAYQELKLDVPIIRSEIKGEKVTLHLYGGQVVTWSPTPEPVGVDGINPNAIRPPRPKTTSKGIAKSIIKSEGINLLKDRKK